MINDPIVILDNGGYRIKYEWSSSSSPLSLPNCIAKVNKSMQSFTGDEIDSIQNTSQLIFSRPFDRGYLINWNLERDILQKVFDSNHLNVNPLKSGLLLTIPPFCPEELQNDTNEVIFEEFGFNSALCRPASWFSAYQYASTQLNEPEISNFTNNSIVIDSGFSFSHILPFIDGKLIKHACKRVNVGGKLLTNYLKETVSFRQWNVMDEFLLMNQVKEDVCFVSLSFDSDLKNCFKLKGDMTVSKDYTRREQNNNNNNNKIMIKKENKSNFNNIKEIYDNEEEKEEEEEEEELRMELQKSVEDNDEDNEDDENDIEYLRKFFVMPDFNRIMKGYVKKEGEAFAPDEQVLTMESERFTIPEVLFHPSDIGLNQAGIIEAAGQSLNSLHELEVGLCVKNIILTGGNSLFPNYKKRIESEIFQYIPSQWSNNVKIYLPDNPIDYAWYGAKSFVQNEKSSNTLNNSFVSKYEYNEYGHEICRRKFFSNI